MKTLSVAHEEKALPGKISEILLLDTIDRACLKNGQHLDSKHFYAIPFQKLMFLIPLYPEFFAKKTRNKTKLIFGQFLLFLFRLPC